MLKTKVHVLNRMMLSRIAKRLCFHYENISLGENIIKSQISDKMKTPHERRQKILGNWWEKKLSNLCLC